MVLTPTFLDGFTATVDYFNIDVSNAISSVAPTVTLRGMLWRRRHGSDASLLLSARSPQRSRPDLRRRLRLGDQPEHGLQAHEGLRLRGELLVQHGRLVDDQRLRRTAVPVRRNVAPELPDRAVAAFRSFAGTGSYDCAGLFGLTCGVPLPKWRHRLRITWATPWDVDFSANWRYMSGVSLDSNTSNPLLHGTLRRSRRDDQRLLVPRPVGRLERPHGCQPARRREQRLRQAAADADDQCVAGRSGQRQHVPGHLRRARPYVLHRRDDQVLIVPLTRLPAAAPKRAAAFF